MQLDLRVKLWKLYFPEDKKNTIPKSGLNFLKDEIEKNNKFLLICGFENLDKFYIRVDILERLFLKIIENSKNGVFKIDSDMINLVGCSKENFFKIFLFRSIIIVSGTPYAPNSIAIVPSLSEKIFE